MIDPNEVVQFLLLDTPRLCEELNEGLSYDLVGKLEEITLDKKLSCRVPDMETFLKNYDAMKEHLKFQVVMLKPKAIHGVMWNYPEGQTQLDEYLIPVLTVIR